MQINFITKKPYAGANQDSLQHEKARKGYGSNEWLTFLQAKGAGIKIKAGQKSTKILRLVETDEEIGAKHKVGIRAYNVFNIDQTEKIK